MKEDGCGTAVVVVLVVLPLIIFIKLGVAWFLTGEGATQNVAETHAQKRWGDKVENVSCSGYDREGYLKCTADLQEGENRRFVCSGFWGECYDR